MLKIDFKYDYNIVEVHGTKKNMSILCYCLEKALQDNVLRNVEVSNDCKVKINVVVDDCDQHSARWRNAMLPGEYRLFHKDEISPEEHCKLVEKGEVSELNIMGKFFHYIIFLSTKEPILNIHCFPKEEYDEVWLVGNGLGIQTLYVCIKKTLAESLTENELTCTFSNFEDYTIKLYVSYPNLSSLNKE